MTTEEKLKRYILLKYDSLRAYVNTSGVGLPYTTVDGILKRGIGKASIDNVIKICKSLRISADELADGKIVPTEFSFRPSTEMDQIIDYTRKHLDEYTNITIDDVPMSQAELTMMLDAVEVTMSLIRRRRQ